MSNSNAVRVPHPTLGFEELTTRGATMQRHSLIGHLQAELEDVERKLRSMYDVTPSSSSEPSTLCLPPPFDPSTPHYDKQSYTPMPLHVHVHEHTQPAAEASRCNRGVAAALASRLTSDNKTRTTCKLSDKEGGGHVRPPWGATRTWKADKKERSQKLTCSTWDNGGMNMDEPTAASLRAMASSSVDSYPASRRRSSWTSPPPDRAARYTNLVKRRPGTAGGQRGGHAVPARMNRPIHLAGYSSPGLPDDALLQRAGLLTLDEVTKMIKGGVFKQVCRDQGVDSNELLPQPVEAFAVIRDGLNTYTLPPAQAQTTWAHVNTRRVRALALVLSQRDAIVETKRAAALGLAHDGAPSTQRETKNVSGSPSTVAAHETERDATEAATRAFKQRVRKMATNEKQLQKREEMIVRVNNSIAVERRRAFEESRSEREQRLDAWKQEQTKGRKVRQSRKGGDASAKRTYKQRLFDERARAIKVKIAERDRRVAEQDERNRAGQGDKHDASKLRAEYRAVVKATVYRQRDEALAARRKRHAERQDGDGDGSGDGNGAGDGRHEKENERRLAIKEVNRLRALDSQSRLLCTRRLEAHKQEKLRSKMESESQRMAARYRMTAELNVERGRIAKHHVLAKHKLRDIVREY